MTDVPITELYKKQISLSEWFEQIGHKNADDLRQEDTTKRDRLGVLDNLISFPYDKPTRFSARQIVESSDEFQAYLRDQGDELCAMRLLPQDKTLPKLRMRGHTIADVSKNWFPQQNIDLDKYLVEFVAHPTTHNWSTIFIVNESGIFGDIIAESHQYLTQGFYKDIKPITFKFDFKNWELSLNNEAAVAHLENVINLLRVSDSAKQDLLRRELGATFSNNYLQGYFETVDSEFGTWFIDYNQSLGKMYSDFVVKIGTGEGLVGTVGAQGVAKGKVRIITNPGGVNLHSDEILVCDMTSPDYVHLMKQAAAIITDRGGMLCHAAIIARELGKPCIVGTENATKILKEGDLVVVDTDKGVIEKI